MFVSFFLETFVSEELDISRGIDNSLVTTILEQPVDIENETSAASTQQTIRESMCYVQLLFFLLVFLSLIVLVTNTHEKEFEQMVKKAMYNIMTGKSVIYAKTDLTQICNKANVRVEAVKRLVSANLLQHGDNFWIEPNRTRKETKKNPKRILREGWLK
jgi:hypothetical protein